MLVAEMVSTLQEGTVTELDKGVIIVVLLTVEPELIELDADMGTTLPEETVAELETMNVFVVQTVVTRDTVVVEELETADDVNVNTDEDDTP